MTSHRSWKNGNPSHALKAQCEPCSLLWTHSLCRSPDSLYSRLTDISGPVASQVSFDLRALHLLFLQLITVFSLISAWLAPCHRPCCSRPTQSRADSLFPCALSLHSILFSSPHRSFSDRVSSKGQYLILYSFLKRSALHWVTPLYKLKVSQNLSMSVARAKDQAALGTSCACLWQGDKLSFPSARLF